MFRWIRRLTRFSTEIPRPRAARTFLLIAKSLQNLANLTTSGAKEPWMEPMNEFLVSQRQTFKDFIDKVCALPSDQTTSAEPTAQYSTPLAIFSRLPPAHKEGFPSLPYIIDHARDFAALVKIWLDNVSSSNAASKSTINVANFDGDLMRFHTLCLHLRGRAWDSFSKAERTERRGSALVQKWVSIAERMESVPSSFWVSHLQAQAALAQQQRHAAKMAEARESHASETATQIDEEQDDLSVSQSENRDGYTKRRLSTPPQDAETDADMTALPPPPMLDESAAFDYNDRYPGAGAGALSGGEADYVHVRRSNRAQRYGDYADGPVLDGSSPLNSSSDVEHSGSISGSEHGHRSRREHLEDRPGSKGGDKRGRTKPRDKGKERERDRSAKFRLFGGKKRTS